MTKTWDISELTELPKVVKEIVEILASTNNSAAAVMALYGDLGAGKTTFTQELGKQLGVSETVTSPTFVVMKHYQTDRLERFTDLIHIDAYRIESIDEMRVLGFADLLKQKGTIICIEWADKISDLLPQDTFHLRFEHQSEGRRLSLNNDHAE